MSSILFDETGMKTPRTLLRRLLARPLMLFAQVLPA